MLLHEVLTKYSSMSDEEQSSHWFRPVGWKGYGEALTLDHEKKFVQYVPTKNGGEDYMTCSLSSLMGEWEIIKIDDVINENNT